MKITRRQIEDAFVQKVDNTAALLGGSVEEISRFKANKKIVSTTVPPLQSGALNAAAAGQQIQTLAFDTAGAVDPEESLYDFLHTPEETIQTARQGDVITTDFDAADLAEIAALHNGAGRRDQYLKLKSSSGRFELTFTAMDGHPVPPPGTPSSCSISLKLNDGSSSAAYTI